MTFEQGGIFMKRMLMQLSISCALGLLAVQAYGEDRVLGHDKGRDCSQMPDAARKARCEAVNKAMDACKGKKAGDELTNCLKQQRKKK